MRIPEGGAQWEDRTSDKLSSCTFQMFCTKMADIQTEFDDSARKQTKPETIAEGFRSVHNISAAQQLIGQKFVISRSGQLLHVTSLPTDILRNFQLPQAYEDELNGASAGNNAPSSGAFAGFSSAPVSSSNAGNDNESKRLSMAAKRMFMSLGASLEVIYAHEDGDLVICEVVDISTKPEAIMSMVEGVFDGGEHPEGADNFRLSFGLLKEIK